MTNQSITNYEFLKKSRKDLKKNHAAVILGGIPQSGRRSEDLFEKDFEKKIKNFFSWFCFVWIPVFFAFRFLEIFDSEKKPE